MKKKIVSSLIVFIAVFAVTTFVRAAINDTTGWLWGGSEDTSIPGNSGVIDGDESGLGWISLNSANSGAGSGSSYVVVVPKTDGAASGYAWSENLGWIDFNPQDHCITSGTPSSTQYKAKTCTIPAGYSSIDKTSGKGGVFRAGNTLIGWARFVGIAKESANDNSGGWDGWIGIGIGNGYDVSLSQNGTMSGYGWSEMGAVNFTGKVAVDPVVSLSISSPLSRNLLSDTENLSGLKASLSWSAVVGNMSSCTKSCKDVAGSALSCPGWDGTVPGTVTEGTTQQVLNINLPRNYVKFVFQCTNTDGVVSNVAEQVIETGCTYKACASQQCQYDMAQFVRANDGSTCPDSSNACSSDGDCEERSAGAWKEVAP